jgi:hypothetical protein
MGVDKRIVEEMIDLPELTICWSLEHARSEGTHMFWFCLLISGIRPYSSYPGCTLFRSRNSRSLKW